MKNIECIYKQDINNALKKEYRQYLTGRLGRPQELNWIDSDIEIGVSEYNEFTANTPHKHPLATEYGYVLCGSVKVLLLDGSLEEYVFNEGDFFVVKPNVGYASKNKEGTKVLFIKAPGSNDKKCVETDKFVDDWLSRWDTT